MKDKDLKQRLEKIRDSLSNSDGEITENIVQELKKITNETKKQQNNAVLTNIKSSIDSNEIASKVSQIPNSDVVDRAIEKTLNSILNPMKVVFTREVSRYIDAISADKKTFKKIPRTVSKKSIKKIENGRFVPASDEDDKVINPEFKQLLASGYKPKDIKEYEDVRDELFPFFKDSRENKQQPPENPPLTSVFVSFKEPEIGDPNSDFIKNFLGGTEPGERIEKIPVVNQEYGSMFVDSLNLSTEQIRYKQTNEYSEINLKGQLKTNIETKQFLPNSSEQDNPNWDINYKEKGNKFFLTIKNNYQYSKKSGLLPNDLTYKLVGDVDDNSLNNNTKNKINEINKGDKCNVQSNKELFSYILSNKLDGIIDGRQNANLTSQEKEKFTLKLQNNHEKLIKSFIQDLFEETSKNRLLESFKMTDPVTGEKQKNNLILLNLINFIPETSDELRACGKNIHPLNIDETVKLMKAKFDSIGLQTFPVEKCGPDEEPKNAITEASFLGSAILLIRISVFEYILKNLIIFDELGYSKTITESSLIKEYISLMVKRDLEELSIYEEVEQIIENSYDLIKENNIIKPEDELLNSNIFSNLVNDVNYEHPSDKIKSVINAIFRKTMNYTKKLLGSLSDESRSELDILSNNIYELNNYKNILNKNSQIEIKYEQLIKNNISNISRLDEKAKKSDTCFILERYVHEPSIFGNMFGNRTQTSFNTFVSQSQFNSDMSFEDYADNVSRIIKNPIQYFGNILPVNMRSLTEQNILSLFGNKIKLSLRFSLAMKTNKIHKVPIKIKFKKPEDIRNKISQENQKLSKFIEDTKNTFYYDTNKSVKIKPQKIFLKKNYVFYDYNENYEVEKENGSLTLYNAIPVEEADIEIEFSQILKYGNTKESILKALDEEFSNKKQQLINNLQQKIDYQIIIRKTMMADKIINLLSFYSYSALSTEEMEGIFSKSKFKLKQLINAAKNIDNYAYQNETDLKGGDIAVYETDLQNTGNPNGSGGFDLLQFLITTPILILKGITQLMDPNIAIASQIVNAASAGLLFPKVDEQGNVQYPGDPFILPTALASMALLPINLLPPGFGIGPPVTPIPGMLYWALEPLLWKLPFFQNQAAKSSDAKKLKDDPKFRGFNVGSQNFSCDKDQDDI